MLVALRIKYEASRVRGIQWSQRNVGCVAGQRVMCAKKQVFLWEFFLVQYVTEHSDTTLH